MAVEVVGLAAALAEVAHAEGLQLTACPDAPHLANSVRAGSGPIVLVSDGVDGAALEALAAAVRDTGRPCIEVRSERWDGQSPSPLSAACRGVISGFGVAAVRHAAAILESP